MSNLENLTEKILEEAKIQADLQLRDAKAFEEDVIAKKVREAEEKKEKMLDKAKFEANLLKERIVSNAEVNRRNELLNGKQKVIDQVFEKAKEKLAHLPQEEYIAFLTNTVASLHLKGTETLKVKEEYKEAVKNLGLSLRVSEDAVSSGFEIQDEKISLNYNFNDMVDFYREELVKDVASTLFRE